MRNKPKNQSSPTYKFCPSNPPLALTIAGSDCSGGAGLEADLKTFSAHRVYGMAVVTCVVAENPGNVVSIHPIPAQSVREQIKCCLQGLPPVMVKTGMLHSASLIRAISKEIPNSKFQIPNLVVDPVMVATSGKRLLQKDAIHALKNFIGQHADMVTPNLDEAEILAEMKVRTESQMEKAARTIERRFQCGVLLKGGHLDDPKRATDLFWDGAKGFWLRSVRVPGIKTHGTGCAYSAALVANLALGRSTPESVKRAKRFMTGAIRHSFRFGPWMALNHFQKGSESC